MKAVHFGVNAVSVNENVVAQNFNTTEDFQTINESHSIHLE